MTHAEKKLNKSDLNSYKQYDQTNHSMIPGINNRSTLALPRDLSPPKAKNTLIPKSQIDGNKKLEQNKEKLL